MELQGKIIAALEPRTGTGAKGAWVSQSFVVETHDQYPKKMVFDVFGQDRLTRFAIKVGQEVNVSFDVDAHEYDGRWYNSIRAFDVRQREAWVPTPSAPAEQMRTEPKPNTAVSDGVAQPSTAAPQQDPFVNAALAEGANAPAEQEELPFG